MARNKQKQAAEELKSLANTDRARADAVDNVRRQLKTVIKVSAIFLVVTWLLAFGFWSGLQSNIPLYAAGGLTVAVGIAAFFIKRNFDKSQEFGALLGEGLSDEDRAARIAKLDAKVDKGDATAIMTKAQMQMQDAPREALETLEKVNLEKANKMVATQVRGMRAMIHLNLGELKAARELADTVDLSKTPDPKSRGNVAAIVAEAWARSGNPIEAAELLDKYDPDHKDFEDIRVQLLRARAFASAHKKDINGMRRALKQMNEISPQLLALFVGQKRIHPLLEKEAKKKLEKSGLMPRQRVQMARR
ncbi:MAG: hypothetical protein RMA76_25205 [Deltaproteobacteria bacterium]